MLTNKIILFFCFCKVAYNTPIRDADLFKLHVIHINDFHARYEETTIDSGICKSHNCIGGFSRLYETVRKQLNKSPDALLLNAGDNFEGTLWYDVFKWNVTQYFLNTLPTDAYTLGNHEFEDKIEGLVPFLQHLNAPVVVANIDASKEPSIQNLIKKSVVVQRNGKKIGIIGVILSTINQIADVGNLVLLDESESVNAEAERLVKEEGVFTNIVLSHSGYDVEQEIARKATSKIGVIVGGHSHSFLYSGENAPGPDIPVGSYPTVINSTDGRTILVVQASSYTKYLGNVTVFYDHNGEVVDWSGSPIYLDTDLPQNAVINDELIPWKKIIDEVDDETVGSTLVRLDQNKCQVAECLLGNFVTDAMVFAYTNLTAPPSWTYASLAVFHGGGLRSGIDIGNITYNEMVKTEPFNNTIDVGDIQGGHLKEIFESTVGSGTINLLQVSGIKIVYNLTRDVGSRVVSMKLRCRECDVPVYEEIVVDKDYRLSLPSFIAEGGFGFTLFKKYLKNRQNGNLDIDVFVNFLRVRSPIFEEVGERIVFV